MPSPWLTCAPLAILAALANAQSGAFDRPTAGYVFSSGSRNIRPLLGIPGATYIGGAVLNDVNFASIAPGGKWAFVTTSACSGFIHGLAGAEPARPAAAGLIETVDRVAWSRDASFAVLYSSSGGRLQRVRLQDAEVSVDDAIDLAPWGAPTALAIDPSGRQIAFGIAGAGVYMIDGAQSPALLVSSTRPAALAFSDAGRLYAVDAETRRIVEFGANLSPLEFAVAETVGEAPFVPVGLAVSGTGAYLMMADRGARTVNVYETATRRLVNTIRLDFAPAQMQALSARATFLLSRPLGKEWLLVLDATDAPRVYFVPAAEEEAQ